MHTRLMLGFLARLPGLLRRRFGQAQSAGGV
jgi:hypothetical protein